MKPREEYNRERAAAQAEKLEQFKEIMKQHPKATVRQLAELAGVSKSTAGVLKKKAEAETP